MTIRYLNKLIRKSENKNNIKDGQIVDYSLTMPVNPRHDDLYLVEFPKSGVTWLSFLFANIQAKMNGVDKNINFYNVIDFVADIHTSRNISGISLPFPGFRIIKSHSKMNPGYKKVIYLVRDPRSLIVSYFKFQKGLGSYNDSLSCFIKEKNFGVDRWLEHVNSWINDSEPHQKIIFVKYEDLIKDTAGCLIKLFLYMGLRVDKEVVEYAVEESSFDKMKTLENLVREYDIRRGEGERFSNFEFVRNGKVDDFGDLSKDDLKFIDGHCSPLMKKLGYV